jgi:ribosomal protein S18 acetylase RimI-like enzyme
MATEWRLRPTTDADRDFLFDLHRQAMRDYVEPLWGWDDAVQRGLFDDRVASRQTHVIQVDDEDIGILQLEQRPDEVVLALIELLPAWQGRGIGTAIIRSLLRQGSAVSLRVLKTNPRAAALYQRLGFRIVMRGPEHFYMRAEPATGGADAG